MKRQGRVIFMTMLFLWLAGTGVAIYSQQIKDPIFSESPMVEGQETRLGPSALILVGTSIALASPLALESLANKKTLVPSQGTFSTDTALFSALLLGIIFIVAGLTFFPALALGPIVEQLLMLKGRTF